MELKAGDILEHKCEERHYRVKVLKDSEKNSQRFEGEVIEIFYMSEKTNRKVGDIEPSFGKSAFKKIKILVAADLKIGDKVILNNLDPLIWHGTGLFSNMIEEGFVIGAELEVINIPDFQTGYFYAVTEQSTKKWAVPYAAVTLTYENKQLFKKGDIVSLISDDGIEIILVTNSISHTFFNGVVVRGSRLGLYQKFETSKYELCNAEIKIKLK
jgi:hypothetical protein